MNVTGRPIITQSSWNATPAPPEAAQEVINPAGNWSEPIREGVASVQGLSEGEQAQRYLYRIAWPLVEAGLYVSIHHPSEWMGTNKNTGKPELQEGVPGYAFNAINDAHNTAFWLVGNKKLAKPKFRNVYLAMSGQIEPKGTYFGKLPIAHRVRPNVAAVHCLWIDIDVKPNDPKAYPSTGEADQAIFKFLKQSGMPFLTLL